MLAAETRPSLPVVICVAAAALAIAVGLSGCSSENGCPRPSGRAPAAAEAVPPFRRVFVVVLENADADEALAQPYLGELAAKGAHLKDFRAVSRPSQPNYIALIGGSTLGVSSNSPDLSLPDRHLGDLLEERGKSWKTYAEGHPGGCFLGASSGAYVRRHVPFLAFENVQRDPSRCARVVPATQLASDVAAERLPDFSLYIPDNDANGHDTGVSTADARLRDTFSAYLSDPKFMDGTLFVVTFDEAGKNSPHNRVYAAMVGDAVRPGAAVETCQDHYSLLRTVEESLGLGTLGRYDAGAAPISGAWN